MPRLHRYPWRGLAGLAALAICGVWLAAESAGQQPSFLPSGSRTRAGGIDARRETTSAPVEVPAEPTSDEAGAASCTDMEIRFVPSWPSGPSSQPLSSGAVESTGFGMVQEREPAPSPAPSNVQKMHLGETPVPAVEPCPGFGQWQEGQGTLKTVLQELKSGAVAGQRETPAPLANSVESKAERTGQEDLVSRLKVLSSPVNSAEGPSQNLARRGGQAHFAPKTPQNEPVADGFGIGSKASQSAVVSEGNPAEVAYRQPLAIAWPDRSGPLGRLQHVPAPESGQARNPRPVSGSDLFSRIPPGADACPASDPRPPKETSPAGYAEVVAPTELTQAPLNPSPPEPPPILRNQDDPSAMNLLPAEMPLVDPTRPSIPVAQQQQLPVVQLPPYRWEHLYPNREKLPEAPPWTAAEAIPSPVAGGGASGMVQKPGPAANQPAVTPQNMSAAETPVALLEPRQSPPQVSQGNLLPGSDSQGSASGVGQVAAGPDGYYPVAPPSAAGTRREPYVPLPMEGYAVGNSYRSPVANRAARGLDPMAYGRSPGMGVPGYGGAVGSYGAGSFSYPGSSAPISAGLPAAGFALPGGPVGQLR